MVHYILLCRSITYAQRLVRVLERAGIMAVLMRPPAEIAGASCAYGVKIRENSLAAALKSLNAAGMSHGKVYLLRQDGSSQEVTHDLS